MFTKTKNYVSGQSEVIGQLLMVALVIVGGTAIGTFYLSNVGSQEPTPKGSVEYTMDTEIVNTGSGPESRFVLTVEATSMSRADTLTVYYEPNSTSVGTMNSVGETVRVGDGSIEIQDGDEFIVIANYEGTRRVVSRYRFDQSNWESRQN